MNTPADAAKDNKLCDKGTYDFLLKSPDNIFDKAGKSALPMKIAIGSRRAYERKWPG